MAEAEDRTYTHAADSNADDSRVPSKSVKEAENKVSRPTAVHYDAYSSVSVHHGDVHSSGAVMYGSIDSSETVMYDSSDAIRNGNNDLSENVIDENTYSSRTEALNSPGRMMHGNTDSSGTAMHSSGTEMFQNPAPLRTVTFGNNHSSGIMINENTDSSATAMYENTDSSKVEAFQNPDSSETMAYGHVNYSEAVTFQDADHSAAVMDRHSDSSETEIYVTTNDDSQEEASTAAAQRRDNDASDRLRDKLLEEWVNAAKCGYTGTLETFLNNGFVTIDVRYHLSESDASLHEGETALLFACQHGQVGAAKLLLERGADVNVRTGDGTGDTALHRVVRAGCRYFTIGHNLEEELVELLLKYGADPNATNHDRQTPLMLAAKNLLPRTVQLLIEAGSAVNHCDRLGQTPLHCCFSVISGSSFLMGDSIHCATLLISAGADMDVACSHYQTPLVLAIKNKNVRGAKFLIMQNCDPDLPSSAFENQTEGSVDDVDSPFRACLHVKDLKTLTFLLQAGCQFEDCSSVDGPTDFEAQVRELLSQPRRLMEACRVAIRRSFRSSGGVGSELMEKVDQLSVPSSLKDFILFRDLKLESCTVL